MAEAPGRVPALRLRPRLHREPDAAAIRAGAIRRLDLAAEGGHRKQARRFRIREDGVMLRSRVRLCDARFLPRSSRPSVKRESRDPSTPAVLLFLMPGYLGPGSAAHHFVLRCAWDDSRGACDADAADRSPGDGVVERSDLHSRL